MLKTMKYRLRPTKKQANLLNDQLEECRCLYNHFLEQRKRSWEDEQRTLTYHAQAITLPQLKGAAQSCR